MRLRVVLVDDGRPARWRLRELLARHVEVEIVGEASDVEEARVLMQTAKPDVVFLEVELSRGRGLDLLPRLSVPLPAVVFVTASDAFAVQAFDAGVFDYLLKPVNPARLGQTVRRLLHGGLVGTLVPNALPAVTTLQLQDRISLKGARTIQVTEVGRIAAIVAEGTYSRVLLRDLAPVTVLRGISDWTRSLPMECFTRLERSLILQISLVRGIEVVSRDEALLTIDGLPAPVTIGRTALRRLRQIAPGGRLIMPRAQRDVR
ncbi:MAG: histidine kinase [Rariglobus sp.]|jgi:two-component system LytT family response regulator|nr:histidine kinase [Rariglobus sp.]